jgi:hypothetical protein
MFEIVVCCVIVFAVGYWATLWTMGRREDVLHGQFVEPDAQPESPITGMPAPPPRVASRPLSATPRPILPAGPPVSTKAPANAEELNSLLVSLKQELKNAAKL